ncbi:MAG TPA: zf-HC2 domain-containing protein [Nakamurella sp.]|jgi:hypothetical protein
MTTMWHADPELLRDYAGGMLDPARAASVELHVQRCPHCRDGVAAYADAELIDLVWPNVVDTLDRPRRSVAVRVAAGLGIRPDLVRLAVGASAAQRAWTGALVVVAAFALTAPGLPDGIRLWFLAAAPLIPVAAVAAAYGPRVDPMFEVIAAAPFPAARLLMLRSLAVLPVAAGLLVLAGLLLPGGWAAGVLWLLPAAGLTLLTLALEPRFGQRPVAGAVAAGWLAVVAGTFRATGSVLPVFGVTGQLLFAGLAGLAVAVVGRGRLEGWRI